MAEREAGAVEGSLEWYAHVASLHLDERSFRVDPPDARQAFQVHHDRVLGWGDGAAHPAPGAERNDGDSRALRVAHQRGRLFGGSGPGDGPRALPGGVTRSNRHVAAWPEIPSIRHAVRVVRARSERRQRARQVLGQAGHRPLPALGRPLTRRCSPPLRRFRADRRSNRTIRARNHRVRRSCNRDASCRTRDRRSGRPGR